MGSLNAVNYAVTLQLDAHDVDYVDKQFVKGHGSTYIYEV